MRSYVSVSVCRVRNEKVDAEPRVPLSFPAMLASFGVNKPLYGFFGCLTIYVPEIFGPPCMFDTGKPGVTNETPA